MSSRTRIIAIFTLLATILILGIVSTISKGQPPTNHPPFGTSIHHDPADAAKDYGKPISVAPNPSTHLQIPEIDLVLQEPIGFQLKEGEYAILGTIAPGPRVSMNCWADQCSLNINKDAYGALINIDADQVLIWAIAEQHTIRFSLGTYGYTIYVQHPNTIGIRI